MEIDLCTKCFGVWLDRGELEKILELETSLVGDGRFRDGYTWVDDSKRDSPRRSLWHQLFG